MDVFDAIGKRRSCRAFKDIPFDHELLERILEAALWAPSPKNAQPWEFVVVTNRDIRKKIYYEAEARRKWVLEKSGWRWLENYNVDFLKAVPVIVAVIGDPDRSGADQFLPEGGMGYQHACAAAVQNMLLAACALNIGSLWFSLFDPVVIRDILGLSTSKLPIALVCLGYPKGDPQSPGRKGLERVVRYIR
jgi:nitroreductase